MDIINHTFASEKMSNFLLIEKKEIYGFKAPAKYITDELGDKSDLYIMISNSLEDMLYELKFLMIYVIYLHEDKLDILDKYVSSCKSAEYNFDEYNKYNEICDGYFISKIHPILLRIDCLLPIILEKCKNEKKNYNGISKKLDLFNKIIKQIHSKINYDKESSLRKTWQKNTYNNVGLKKEHLKSECEYIINVPVYF